MAVRAILRFPDPRLRAPAERVALFDDDLRALADDLLETMRAGGGIGITAPHLGVPQRLVVIDPAAATDARCYANPQILEASTEMVRSAEGSVSMPGVTEQIDRHARVRIGYQDLDGVERVQEADGLLAICLQHEIDQLDGTFWIYRLSRLKRDRLVKRFEKLGRS